MAESKNVEKRGEVLKNFNILTLAEIVNHIAASKIKRGTPKQKWLRLAKNIKEKYDLHSTKFDFLNKRVSIEEPKQKHSLDSKYVYPPEPEKDVSPGTNFEEGGLRTKIERSSHFILDSRLKDTLAGVLNIRIPSVKVYTNQTSDALVKRFNADALTYENQILFRAGKYDPRSKKGIALLGHELTHAAQSRMCNKNVPGYMKTSDRKATEQEALNNEKKVIRYFSTIGAYRRYADTTGFGAKPSHINDRQLSLTKTRSLMSNMSKIPVLKNEPKDPLKFNSGTNQLSLQTALSSRNLTMPPEMNTNVNISPELTDKQLRYVKEEVYRDIMNRIRIEFERGG